MYQQQWNNDHIYPGLDSPELEADMSAARHALEALASYMAGLDGVRGDDAAMQDFFCGRWGSAPVIFANIGWNVAILAVCRGSQAARDPQDKQLASRALNADLFKTLAPVEDLMLALPEDEFAALMRDLLARRGGVPLEP